jgi:Ca2+/Na+ antiporter
MNTWILAFVLGSAFAALVWLVGMRRWVRTVARHERPSLNTWLIFCLFTVTVTGLSLALFVFDDGDPTHLIRAVITALLTLLLWNLYRKQRSQGG